MQMIVFAIITNKPITTAALVGSNLSHLETNEDVSTIIDSRVYPMFTGQKVDASKASWVHPTISIDMQTLLAANTADQREPRKEPTVEAMAPAYL